MERAGFKDGTVETNGKPYSACMLRFGPTSDNYLVKGKTENVRRYWDSFHEVEFQWYLFDTEEEMDGVIPAIMSLPADGPYWRLFDAVDVSLGEEPVHAQEILSVRTKAADATRKETEHHARTEEST